MLQKNHKNLCIVRTVWIEFFDKNNIVNSKFSKFNREIYQTKTQNIHLNFIANIYEFCVNEVHFYEKKIVEVWIK